MDWIEHDQVRFRPSDGDPTDGRTGARVDLDEHGVSVIERGLLSSAPWESVLGVALVPTGAPERAYVLVPRKPPLPPWFEVVPAMLPPALAAEGLGGLAHAISGRIRRGGYRQAAPRPRLSTDELARRAFAHEEIRGALVVPIGRGPIDAGSRLAGHVAGAAGGGISTVYFGAVAAVPLWALAVLGASGIAGGLLLPALVRKRAKGRVLLLAPDGCVVGLPTGVRAFGWSEVQRFAAGQDWTPRVASVSCLEVWCTDGSLAGRVDAAWFTRPLELIVAIAEAYRRRIAG